ncbi:MAG: ATP-dependent DNA helicase [Nitrososphaerota archaeon]
MADGQIHENSVISSISREKQEILNARGNTLVVANPGTGKTLLLAHKFTRLVKSGVKPEDILCLTFTNKAKSEMESRIIDISKAGGLELDLSKLNIFTFHSYALNSLGDRKVVPQNLLRYTIYRYFTDTKALNYGEDYLIDTIVPKMENLIRYLKSFKILPDDIDTGEVKKFLSDTKQQSKEEMDRFADVFKECYSLYEKEKRKLGIDYADMLIDFLKMKDKPKYKYVLIDELQDLNELEAKIALESGDVFFAVGDKKQAIFGFQGGSINNFKKFQNSNQYVLSENFRSSNEILNYAKGYFIANTKDEQHKTDVKNLKNVENKSGERPFVYDVSGGGTRNSGSASSSLAEMVCEIYSKLMNKGGKVAIIARTNGQILNISKELEKRGVKFSSTYFSASDRARKTVIDFVLGLLSKDIRDIRNSLFTPFAPISLRDALDLSKKKIDKLTLEDIYSASPEFKAMREGVKNLCDLDKLFKERILPVSVPYGKEFFLAILNIKDALDESLELLQEKGLNDVVSYLKASDPLTDESDVEKDLILTTVHKAKGREFDYVIYVPSKPRDLSNFQDEVVKAILKTKGISVDEELDEESLRVDFVAFTRAKNELHIVSEKPDLYLTEYSTKRDVQIGGLENSELYSRYKEAFNLFINGNPEKSKALLDDKSRWVLEFIKEHFESLNEISFSALGNSAEDYLVKRILRLEVPSSSTELGTRIHEISTSIFNGKEYQVQEEDRPFVENVLKLMEEIMRTYPDKVSAEYPFSIPLEQLVGYGKGLIFGGRIDAIYRNGDSYLIVDWKTDRDKTNGSTHKRQLETYRRAYSVLNNIPLENIKVAIGYIGLRPTVNLGRIDCSLDDEQPKERSFETVKSHISKLLSWKNDPTSFFSDLKCTGKYSVCEAILEQYSYESGIS